jgi:peptide/nickel transport system substrate-binding protein
VSDKRGYWQKRATRRRILGAASAGSVGLAALAIGCSRESTPTGTTTNNTPTEAQPKRGGTVNAQGTLELQGRILDPHRNISSVGMIMRLWYQGLLNYDPRTYEVKPELAQKWEQPSETEYIFSLQPGVKWHNKPPVNGRTLTVNDVVYSLERVRTNDPLFSLRSVLSSVDKIEAVGQDKIRVTTKSPDATTLGKFSSDGLQMVAQEAIDKGQKFLTAEEVVGTGPFVVNSLEQNVASQSTRNPDYWKPGLPYLDAFNTYNFADDQTAYAAFQGGNVDVARYVPGTEVKNYIAKRGADYTPDWFYDDTQINLHPQVQNKPMDDVRVTKALRLLMDHDEWRTAWCEVWFGRGRHGSIFPTALEAWDFTDEEYARNLEWKAPKTDAAREALSLLNGAGYNQSNPLKFELTTYGVAGSFVPVGGELLQAQWKRLSQGVVDAELKVVDTATWNTVRSRGQFQYMTSGVITLPEPDSWLSELYRTGGSQNNMKFSDSRLDSMIDRQRTLFDVQQRKTAVRDIVTYLIDNAPNNVGSNRYFLNAVNPRLRNRPPQFIMKGAPYEQVWLES